MLGCDYHCGYCQNWITSQALRDEKALAPVREVTAEALAELAVQHHAPTVVSTYNEPLITSEWAVKIFKEARQRGLATGYVSNGNGTPEVLDYIEPFVDLYKVDLKGFQDKSYRQLGGVLKNVLWTIEALVERGFWVEVVTLVVPGFNDSAGELRQMAEFLVNISPDIPWHVTAFHQDYKMTGPRNTNADDLAKAYSIGREAGLRYVYAGNRPGQVEERENTFCPDCGATVVRRTGFHVRENRITPAGACPDCGATIPGPWTMELLRARRESRVPSPEPRIS
jgi:pyruvate formate lyase activating enzyme